MDLRIKGRQLFILTSTLFLFMALTACSSNAITDTVQLPTLASFPTSTPSAPTPSATLPPVTAIVGIPTPTPGSTFGEIMGELVAGQTQGGLFEADALQQVYTFEGQSGQLVTLQLARVSGNHDPFLRLISPEGRELAVDDNSGADGTALLRNIPLSIDGEYRVQASGKGRTGGYSLVMTFDFVAVTPVFVTPTPLVALVEVLTPTLATAVSGRNQLQDHVPLIGSISRQGDFDRYSLFAAVGEHITVGVSPLAGSTLQPNIELIGPDGDVVAAADPTTSAANGDALVANFPVRITATYSLHVTGLENSTGDYVVSYGRGVSREEVMRGRTLADEIYEGSLQRRGLRDVWSLFLNAGDVIAAAATPNDSSFDPVLEFALASDESPDDTMDNLIASDDNSGEAGAALIVQATAPQTGLYHLRVTAAGAVSIGSYNLVWRYINAAPTPTPLPGVVPLFTVQDVVPRDTYLFFPFQGQRGQQLQFRVRAANNSTLDPVAALLDDTGEVIASADDSDGTLNPRFTFTIPANGTYTVRINGYLSEGEFELVVERLFPLQSGS
jgi:hypothetical protein